MNPRRWLRKRARLLRAQAAQLPAIDPDRSLARLIERAEQVEQGRLATARRPHHRHRLAGRDTHFQPVQHPQRFARGFIHLGNIPHLDHHAHSIHKHGFAPLQPILIQHTGDRGGRDHPAGFKILTTSGPVIVVLCPPSTTLRPSARQDECHESKRPRPNAPPGGREPRDRQIAAGGPRPAGRRPAGAAAQGRPGDRGPPVGRER